MTDTITDRDLGNLSNAIKAPWSRAHQEFTPQNWEHIITRIIGVIVNAISESKKVILTFSYKNKSTNNDDAVQKLKIIGYFLP